MPDRRGAAVAEAMARAQHHRQRSARNVRVRLLIQWGEGEGLTVQARIAGRCESELVPQEGLDCEAYEGLSEAAYERVLAVCGRWWKRRRRRWAVTWRRCSWG